MERLNRMLASAGGMGGGNSASGNVSLSSSANLQGQKLDVQFLVENLRVLWV
jgi:hypothetical protein